MSHASSWSAITETYTSFFSPQTVHAGCSINPDLVTFQDFVNVDENLTPTELRDINTIFSEVKAEEADEDKEDDSSNSTGAVPSYMSALGDLETLRHYLQISDVASNSIIQLMN